MEDIVLLEAIEKYLKGELQPGDLAHFEHLRKSNAEIDQMVVEHTFFLKQLESINDRKHFKAHLEQVHSDLQHQNELGLPKEAKIIGFYGKYRKKLAVAATIAALVTVSALGILFAYNKGKNERQDYIELSQQVSLVDQKLKNVTNIIENVRNNAVKPTIIASTSGTGFIINENGYIITNNHVVKANKKVYVYNEKYGDLEAEVLMNDFGNDLAVIKITDTAFHQLKQLPFSFIKDELNLGQRIYTLGFSRSNSLVYNEGFISSKAANTAIQNKEKFLLTLQVDGGNSGSPILNNNGEIVGIIAAKEVMENGYAVGVKPSSIKLLIDNLNTQLEKGIKLPVRSNFSRFSRDEQIKKMSDYIFMVKIK